MTTNDKARPMRPGFLFAIFLINYSSSFLGQCISASASAAAAIERSRKSTWKSPKLVRMMTNKISVAAMHGQTIFLPESIHNAIRTSSSPNPCKSTGSGASPRTKDGKYANHDTGSNSALTAGKRKAKATPARNTMSAAFCIKCLLHYDPAKVGGVVVVVIGPGARLIKHKGVRRPGGTLVKRYRPRVARSAVRRAVGAVIAAVRRVLSGGNPHFAPAVVGKGHRVSFFNSDRRRRKAVRPVQHCHGLGRCHRAGQLAGGASVSSSGGRPTLWHTP